MIFFFYGDDFVLVGFCLFVVGFFVGFFGGWGCSLVGNVLYVLCVHVCVCAYIGVCACMCLL